ncbi:hypothetical protein H9Q08_03360 [Chryseobacterium sp. PS-8]|uniref:Cthe-2314-like HEPN domain-containing protein n=1 Tax=Chryseobacterium indicum TaxID=2766954 RepID=A0ABS9C285_9FLAO|nr:hypothetical protein [Chryseobacterium sp. PS-8]MCF2218332.1 hypothetical protein [Chryseobacterium sp. PS-8]
MDKKRLVIKGTILVGSQSFKVGEDIFSSVLLSVMSSWYYSTYSSAGEPLRDYSEQELREFGKIRLALNGYINDLHNISINYSLFKEINNNTEIGIYKGNIYLESIFENIFTNLRSLYDFFYHFIKICLNEKQLKQYPITDSINTLASYAKKTNNADKLPSEIIRYLEYIQSDLDDIKKIRDSIIHKGKDIMLTRDSGKLCMRMPIKDLFSKDNLLPNILEEENLNYDVAKYLSKIIKTTFKNMEILGDVIYSEVYNNENYKWGLYAISNYCIDDFNDFLILENFG